jgi:hypothetical protein
LTARRFAESLKYEALHCRVWTRRRAFQEPYPASRDVSSVGHPARPSKVRCSTELGPSCRPVLILTGVSVCRTCSNRTRSRSDQFAATILAYPSWRTSPRTRLYLCPCATLRIQQSWWVMCTVGMDGVVPTLRLVCPDSCFLGSPSSAAGSTAAPVWCSPRSPVSLNPPGDWASVPGWLWCMASCTKQAGGQWGVSRALGVRFMWCCCCCTA